MIIKEEEHLKYLRDTKNDVSEFIKKSEKMLEHYRERLLEYKQYIKTVK